MRVSTLILLVLLCATLGNAQSQTTRLRDSTFSQLNSGNPPNDSVRYCTNCTQTFPCAGGGTGAVAHKIDGAWSCTAGAPGSGSSSPINATYITQTPNSTLTNEQALSILTTGLMKTTNGTGLVSIAVPGTDFLAINGSGAQLTTLNASQLTSGTVPDARFPATLPALNGVNLTNLNATNLLSGVVSRARGGFGADVSAADGLPFFTAGVPAFTATTGTDVFVRKNGPVLTAPTIADFSNSSHTHTNAAGGGQLTDAALSVAVSIAKGGTGQTSQTAGFNALDPLTTKGDLLSHDGTNSIRLPVGANGECAKANSGTASGLEWGPCGVGTGDVVGPASATDNAVVRFDAGTGKLVQNSGVTVDDSDNISTTGTITSGSGSSVAGTVELGEGTAPSLVANTFSIYSPTDVAAGGIGYVLPGSAATGFLLATNSAGVMTLSHVGSTGSDNVVRATSPTLVTPTLGAATATSINGLTITSTTGTLTVTNGKTATFSNTLTFTGTDSSSVAFGTGGTVAYTITSGTSALGTSAIASGACASAVTTTATGTATTDVVWWGFNGDPTGVTGYAPTANGMLTIIAYPSANNVNFKVCNLTASSITPGAVTLNWRIVR